MAAQLRRELSSAQKIIIKCGTSVVSHRNGEIALGRLAYIVEQIAALVMEGKQVLLVSSGSIGVGRQKLRSAQLLTQSLSWHMRGNRKTISSGGDPFDVIDENPSHDPRACAAAGQSGLINLYEVMLGQYGVQCAQVLVTADDFTSETRRENLKKTLSQLQKLGVIPILNENDVISESNAGKHIFWDNDSLAGLIASEIRGELLIILSDIDGVYKKDPRKHPNQRPIPSIFIEEEEIHGLPIEIGEKSDVGRGGMEAKLSAVNKAVRGGVPYVLIANGYKPHTITRIIRGELIGTLFTRTSASVRKSLLSKTSQRILEVTQEEIEASHHSHHDHEEEDDDDEDQISALREIAENARNASRWVRCLSGSQRAIILESIAHTLDDNISPLLQANTRDVETFQDQIASESSEEKRRAKQVLEQRLQLSEEKLHTVIKGLKSLADRLRSPTGDPLSEVISLTEISEGLELVETRAPIGVLMVVFEARPEVLPQIAGLSLAAGNAVILKGGKEAIQSNTLLLHFIQQGIRHGIESLLHSSSPSDSLAHIPETIEEGLVHLVSNRNQVTLLLKIGEEGLIDLVIPRGGNALVKHIKNSTKIPVLGHADGICHIYLHDNCDLEKASRIVIDSKTDYPAACNAVECLLMNRELFLDGRASRLINELTSHHVEVFTGPRAFAFLNRKHSLASSMSKEYSALQITIEMVDDVHTAIEFINTNGSGHTDCIVTEDQHVAQLFQNGVDSACVFWNCSTRFADGYRFGLGAEVGISTNRIHARGPVGLNGLTVTKWKLTSLRDKAHCVSDFSSKNPSPLQYTHVSKL